MSQVYVGAKISLISKSNLRFVGTLHSINQEESSVALEQVRSYGTEGRMGNPSDEIEPVDQIFPFIVFKGSDVKDLHIINHPPPPPPVMPPGYPMPAIPPGMNPFYAQQMAFQQQQHQQQQHQHQQQQYWQQQQQQQQQPQHQSSTVVPAQIPAQQPAPPAQQQPRQSVPAEPLAQMPASSLVDAGITAPPPAVPAQRNTRSDKTAPPASGPAAKQAAHDATESVTKGLGSMKIGGEPPSKESAHALASTPTGTKDGTKKHHHQQQQQQQQQSAPPRKTWSAAAAGPAPAVGQPAGVASSDPLALPSKPAAKSDGRADGKRPQTGNGDDTAQESGRQRGGRGGGRRAAGGQPQDAAGQPAQPRGQRIVIPDSEFDFESANAKFDKSNVEQEQLHSGESSDDPVFYSKSNFFDNISCDSRDRAEGERMDRRTRMSEERRLNLETFGQAGSRGGHFRRYNNGGGARQNGGRQNGGAGGDATSNGFRRGGRGGRSGRGRRDNRSDAAAGAPAAL
ncbi:hypothetical protein HK105_202766 [Polyrhizophydium stewartii]|uniref:Uncharacterized protein n=1 Tax=Polyrhizophydium stewartii TaxID=2732419 RepID=A0ABR4ND76_9FUNG